MGVQLLYTETEIYYIVFCIIEEGFYTMIIETIMKRNPVYVTPDMSLTEVRELMTKEGIEKFPVLDDDSNLVGVITKKDLMRADPSSATTLDMYELSYLLSKIKVKKIMVKDILTVSESEVIEEAARIMADKNVGCLPVTRGNTVVGMVTETDLFHAMIAMFGAWHKGVRITFELDEKPGQIAKLAQAIANKNGNIISLITSDGVDVKHKRCTCKTVGISIDELQSIMNDMGAIVEDIR